jgi:hypothetical protein
MIRNIPFIRKLNRPEAERFVRVTYDALLRRTVDENSLSLFTECILDGMKPSEFIRLIGSSEEYRSLTGYSVISELETPQIADIKFKATKVIEKKIKNIVYFAPSINKPVGGIKVIIRHSETVGSLENGLTSQIFFPENINTFISWLIHDANIKRDNIFDPNSDFIVLPEIWASTYSGLLLNEGVNYGIFVQNGYDIFKEVNSEDPTSINNLRIAYKNASKILTISDDTSKCIKATFPEYSNKIQQLSTSVNSNIFNLSYKKENIITYMPRKLSSHSSWIINQFNLLGKNDWEILPIAGMPEDKVAEALGRSKIFLSFSEKEGLSLPPLEAALCGNIVIGYTGEGASEYWKGSAFRTIESGNLSLFLSTLKIEMDASLSNEKFMNSLSLRRNLLEELKHRYSSNIEIINIKKFVESL